MTDKQQPQPERIDPTFRNGSMTAVGIIFGFSLNFLRSWGANPVPWQLADLFAVVPLLAGIFLQFVAFAQLLRPNSVYLSAYNKAQSHFLRGTVLVLVGVCAALLLDVLEQSAPDLLR